MPSLIMPSLLKHKLELAIIYSYSTLLAYKQIKHTGHISFLLTSSEAPSKGPYTCQLLIVFLLPLNKKCLSICRHTGLINGERLWTGKLWVLISKADCNLTKSSKNKFCSCERCHLVCLRGWNPLFMHRVGTAQRGMSWFSSNHSHQQAQAKKKAHTFPGRKMCLSAAHLTSGVTAGTVWAGGKGRARLGQLWWCKLSTPAFLPGKRHLVWKLVPPWPRPNDQPKPILHNWPLAFFFSLL